MALIEGHPVASLLCERLRRSDRPRAREPRCRPRQEIAVGVRPLPRQEPALKTLGPAGSYGCSRIATRNTGEPAHERTGAQPRDQACGSTRDESERGRPPSNVCLTAGRVAIVRPMGPRPSPQARGSSGMNMFHVKQDELMKGPTNRGLGLKPDHPLQCSSFPHPWGHSMTAARTSPGSWRTMSGQP
ncbi:hypothetical protein J3A64_003698 [Pseudarthrobacter sp. PvP004]|nr:hypothetical protein [Pseudarthrobacter sp. PvP004]